MGNDGRLGSICTCSCEVSLRQASQAILMKILHVQWTHGESLGVLGCLRYSESIGLTTHSVCLVHVNSWICASEYPPRYHRYLDTPKLSLDVHLASYTLLCLSILFVT